mmetsp:Transcript_17790/g.38751  ORF Transcript_17790/g.38751 Transcript_17790/m.38751 type:complete len:135 (+) Transcript_17790:123-527(+)
MTFLHPGTDDPNVRYMIEGYKNMKRRQEDAAAAAAQFEAFFYKSLNQLQTNEWRFLQVPLADRGHFRRDKQMWVKRSLHPQHVATGKRFARATVLAKYKAPVVLNGHKWTFVPPVVTQVDAELFRGNSRKSFSR